jgi:hypothetical protein
MAARAAAAKKRIRERESQRFELAKSQTGNRGFHSVERSDDDMNITQRINKSIDDRYHGRLTDAEVAKQHQAFAWEMFPDAPNVGTALQRFYDSHIGKRVLRNAVQVNHWEGQFASACGDGFKQGAKKFLKGEIEEPFNRSAIQPKVHLDHPTGVYDDGDDPDAELEKLGEAYRRANPGAPLTREQAITHVATHTPQGRQLLELSKMKSLSKNDR